MKQEKIVKLPMGEHNVPYIRCKASYAEGVAKPKREKKIVPFNPPTILRKAA